MNIYKNRYFCIFINKCNTNKLQFIQLKALIFYTGTFQMLLHLLFQSDMDIHTRHVGFN